jgi:hypothetical protein
MIDVNTAPFEEIEALPDFIREKMRSSDGFKRRIKHAENMSAARANLPERITAELQADEAFAADETALPSAIFPALLKLFQVLLRKQGKRVDHSCPAI